MKKNLLYLLMLLCSVSMFTSCGDDDDKDDNKADVAGTYAGTLGVTLDGEVWVVRQVNPYLLEI